MGRTQKSNRQQSTERRKLALTSEGCRQSTRIRRNGFNPSSLGECGPGVPVIHRARLVPGWRGTQGHACITQGLTREAGARGGDGYGGDLWWGFSCLQLWELVKQAPRGCGLCVWCWSLRSARQAVSPGELQMIYIKLERKPVKPLAKLACSNGHSELHIWGATWGFLTAPPQKAPGPEFFPEVEFERRKHLDVSFPNLLSIVDGNEGTQLGPKGTKWRERGPSAGLGGRSF